jgi:hypothetical protein
MIDVIKEAAEAVGITAVVTNSTDKIEVQLNRLTGQEDLPLMLVSWDLDTTYEFDNNGFLKNPRTKVVVLLMDKAEDKTKDELEATAVRMEQLYQQFIQTLRRVLIPLQTNYEAQPVLDIASKLAPNYGLGVHSGVVGRFTMSIEISNC